MAVSRWQDHVQTGTHAARPAASATAVDALYSCTDHGIIYQSDGSSTWADYYDPDDATLTTHEGAADPHTVYVKESEFTGADIVLIGTGAGTLTAFKHNFGATADPTATDDSAAGYATGSVWVDETNDKSWVCVDATASAAVWKQTGGTGAGTTDHGALSGLSDDDHPQYVKDSEYTGDDIALIGTGAGTFEAWKHNFAATVAPGGTDDSSAGYMVGSIWIDVTGDKVYICYDATASSALWQEVGAGGGGGSALTVTDESGTVSDTAVTSITVPDGTLVDDGVGLVTLRTVPAGVVGASVWNNAAQSLTDSATTKLTMNSTAWDTDSFFDDANDRLTVPAGMGGKYVISGRTTWSSHATGGRFLYIQKNGSNLWRSGYIAGVGTRSQEYTVLADLAAGDYIELFGLQYSGGALNAGDTTQAYASTLEMMKVGSGTVGETIGVKAYATSVQSATSSVWTYLNCDSEDFDTDGFHDTVTNPSRFTIPAGLSGWYLVQGYAHVASNSTGYRRGIFYKNGTTYIEPYFEQEARTGGAHRVVVSGVHYLEAGDYVEFGVMQNSGGALDVGDASDRYSQTTVSLVLLATQGAGGLKEGTAFPTGPATGDRYRRTDLDYEVFFYDGTRWLSEQVYSLSADVEESTQGGLSSTDTDWRMHQPFQTDFDCYIMYIECSMYVATTNDGSNYWSMQFKDSGNNSLGSATDTSADAASTYLSKKVTINALANSGTTFIYGTATKVASPGNLFVRAAAAFFRKVAT